ncbi:hypothetical protein [Leptospira sp. GIMC2001]|uniref:hypothetical protein n=1 Tax=Leptospira sp. GIMC2001 TaxID=1513297 RepID=UPI00234B950B|nr:hypothetical protein [Leptospira sp. GIMC2001]WCL48546.1 hypothetical protein O4O04_14725 [Leptospira sp. GIMC2001]
MTLRLSEKLWQNRIRLSFLGLVGIFIISYQYIDWIFFSNSCPNIRQIGWDPASRFLASLDIAFGIRSGYLWVPFAHIFDSPTWPAIRSLLESLLILGYGADPIISIFLTKVTETVLIFSIAIVFFVKFSNWIDSIFYFLVFVLLYYSIPSILLFSYSGMLEIQGALFMIATLVSMQLYETRKNKILFPISVFLLLQTKYPYVLMFLMAFTIYLPFIYLKEIQNSFEIFSKNFKIHIQRNVRLLFLPIPLVLFLLGKFDLLNWSPKLSSYLVYLVFLLVLLDVFVFIFRNQVELKLRSSNLFYFLKWIYLPSIAWLIIHPDRFVATTNTVLLEQGDSNIFFYLQTMTNELFFLYPLLVLLAISISYNLWKYKNKYFTALSFTTIAFFWIILILLSFSSSNRQERHILHLYPMLIMGFALNLELALRSLPLAKLKYSIIGLCVIYLFFFIGKNSYFKYNNLIMPDGNLITNRFMPRVHCYAGNKTDVRAVPNWVKSEAENLLQDSTIVFNQLPGYHINKPDSDLELSIQIYNFKKSNSNTNYILNPKTRHLQNIDKYTNILILGNECSKNHISEFTKKQDEEIKLIPIAQKKLEADGINPSACLDLYRMQLL